ncbi:unnamed protein product [marine sediment metagenome]|uniref:Uncharacterized protein n=1 Tax=marine sediment metagenome TaxID=412755 RepID=X1JHU0_9ZZZZ
MVELKTKTKKDKAIQQELKKDNPINLIDAYFTFTINMFNCKNIKRRDRNVR